MTRLGTWSSRPTYLDWAEISRLIGFKVPQVGPARVCLLEIRFSLWLIAPMLRQDSMGRAVPTLELVTLVD